MKRITILAATTALLAFPAIGSTAAFAATDDGAAAQVRVHAKHGADDPAGHRRHNGTDDKAGARKHGADDPAGHHRHGHHHHGHHR
jgi:hypothetical protein